MRQLQSTLVALVSSAIPSSTVLWGWQRHHRDASADVQVEIRDLSTTLVGKFGRGSVYDAPASATITVPAVVPGVRYFVGINGVDVWTDAIGGDTSTTVRDRLLAAAQAIAADVVVTPTPSGAASLVLTPATPGALYGLVVVPPLAGVVGTIAPYRLRTAACVLELEVQVYVRKGAAPLSSHNGAPALAQQLVADLTTDAALAALEAAGFGLLGFGNPVNLTAISGGDLESRASVDLRISGTMADFQPVGVIERVESGSVLLSDPPNTIALAPIVAP